MGKNRVVRTLGNRIGNVVMHRLLVKYTHKPESISHLQDEESEYRDAAIKEAKKYNWNEQDKQEIKVQALHFIKIKKEQKYEDVEFSWSEAEELIGKEIIDIGL